jgi:DNA transformation protein and related proteins
VDEATLQDLFGALGVVRARRMFGGQGIYLDGQIFAIEAGGELYLKADAVSAERFRGAGSIPFTYAKANGTQAAMRYWRLPEAALDDPEEAVRWARLALAAGARTGRRPKRRRETP